MRKQKPTIKTELLSYIAEWMMEVISLADKGPDTAEKKKEAAEACAEYFKQKADTFKGEIPHHD